MMLQDFGAYRTEGLSEVYLCGCRFMAQRASGSRFFFWALGEFGFRAQDLHKSCFRIETLP